MIRILLTTLLVASIVAEPARAAERHDASTAEYRIGPEDVLDVAIWNHADLAKVVPVRPDGRISLPLVNDVVVAGLTPMELRDILMEKFALYVPNAEVSVIVREIHSFKVSVIGNVRKPGRFELKSRTTVLDVLALAEGLTEFADRHRIVILRYEGSELKRLRFNYDDSISEGGVNGTLFLQPGDSVVVP